MPQPFVGYTRTSRNRLGSRALNSGRAPATILKPCNCAGLYFWEAAPTLAQIGRNPTTCQRTVGDQAARSRTKTIGRILSSRVVPARAPVGQGAAVSGMSRQVHARTSLLRFRKVRRRLREG